MTNVELTIKGDVHKLTPLEDGEWLLVTVPDRVGADQLHHVCEKLKHELRTDRVLVIDSDVTVTKMTPA